MQSAFTPEFIAAQNAAITDASILAAIIILPCVTLLVALLFSNRGGR